MKWGRIHDRNESLEDDDSKHGDDNDDDDGDEDKRRLSKDDKKGFIFSAVNRSDDSTYKCEAKKQNQQEVMYFYLHVGK